MVAQVQTRNMAHKADNKKAFGVFIKKTNHKKQEIIKPKEDHVVRIKITNNKWEPKKLEHPKASEAQGGGLAKPEGEM